MRAVIFLGDSLQSPLVVRGTEHAWVANSWVNRLAGQLEVHSRLGLREADRQSRLEWRRRRGGGLARTHARTQNTGRADETLLRASRLLIHDKADDIIIIILYPLE